MENDSTHTSKIILKLFQEGEKHIKPPSQMQLDDHPVHIEVSSYIVQSCIRNKKNSEEYKEKFMVEKV